ncbi:hypothetical protein [Dactylosporangium sp. CA-233914]|uniref:hypothetical protein n=1 Tax=Dactylosporangium sp. CA-233914 TaxID=3239934 RepID=UPI003D8C505C
MAPRRAAPRNRASALASLTLAEKGELLGRFLTAQPELREQVEELARLQLIEQDRDSIASDIEDALNAHDIDELNSHAGYHPGRGYVDPGEAADEILDEDLQPFLDDLARRAELGFTAAAAQIAAGILCGLYACREANSETLLEYTPDYPVERAHVVIDQCTKLGVTLPVDDLLDEVPEWAGLLPATRAG